MVEGKWGGVRVYPWGEVLHLTAVMMAAGLGERELSIFKVFFLFLFFVYLTGCCLLFVIFLIVFRYFFLILSL